MIKQICDNCGLSIDHCDGKPIGKIEARDEWFRDKFICHGNIWNKKTKDGSEIFLSIDGSFKVAWVIGHGHTEYLPIKFY